MVAMRSAMIIGAILLVGGCAAQSVVKTADGNYVEVTSRDSLAYTTEEDRPNIHHCHIGERFGLSRDTEMHLCRDLPIPFVGLRSDNTPYFSTSGGPWSTIDEGHSVALVGKRQRMMWTWTSCPGAGMGVKIRAWVNVWYTPHNPFKLRG